MIDAASARALDRLEARKNDLNNAFTPGFHPADADAASRTTRTAASNDGLTVAAPDGAYFVGSDRFGRRFYSRDGSLRLDGTSLVTRNGSNVLGYAPDATMLAPLSVDPVDAALGRINDARVDADGSVSYARRIIDPKTGVARDERVSLGRLALARFPAGTALHAADGVHADAPTGVTPWIGLPGTQGTGNLRPRRRDLGAVDVQASIAGLRDAYLAFDAIRAAAKARSGTDKTAMDLIK